MAVEDTWHLSKKGPDGQKVRSARYGRGLQWRVRWQGATKSFRTRQEADDYWLAVRTTNVRHRSKVVPVGDLLDRWQATKQGLSKPGRDVVAAAHHRATVRWGNVPAVEVRPSDVRAWVAGLDCGASSKIKAMQAMTGAMDIAIEDGMIAKNPCRDVKQPREKPREARYRTAEQVRKLALCADACGGYGPLVWFLATSGLRPGEAFALNVGDVDVKRRRVRVRAQDVGASKSPARDVPVAAPVLDMLDLRRPKSAPLFVSPSGRRLNVHNWGRRHFREAAWLAWMDGVRPYDLRHTAVSLAVSNGEHVKVIQRMVGHKPGSNLTEGRYAHLFDADLDRAADRMAGLVKR